MTAGRQDGKAAREVAAGSIDLPTGRPAALLLYDGTCGFCAASVQWVLARDRVGTLRFAPLQGETARPILARHPELASVDSVVWIEKAGRAGEVGRAGSTDDGEERMLVRSAAALAVGRYLGGGWSVVARLAALLPRPVRDRVYDLIAKHRHRIIPGDAACILPTTEERRRFLS